jgi:hypothetical protein
VGGARLVAGALAVAAVLAACEPEPTGPVSLPLANAASARVYLVAGNQDWTAHIPLTEAFTDRLQVRLYTASGREIVPPAHPVDLSFSFSPATLATATVADSALLLFDITPADPPGAEGTMTITFTEGATATTKSFGPFYVLVH